MEFPMQKKKHNLPWARLSLIFIILISGIFFPNRTEAKEISVELVWNFGQAGWAEIRVQSGSYQLSSPGNKDIALAPGELLQFGWGGWTPVWQAGGKGYQIFRGTEVELKMQEKGSFLLCTPDGKKAEYRGGLKVAWIGDHWRLTNNIDLEDYLKGVVPMEMENGWAAQGLEALKAQSIAARTYAVSHTQGGAVITDSPDHDQAYGGKKSEGDATAAVEATKGEVLVDEVSNQPVDALYSAHNGGFSETAENVWGKEDTHYTAHPDPFSEGIGGAADQWSFQISAIALGQRFGLDVINKIELERYPSGRVKKVRMTDRYGQELILSGRKFVQKFYPFGEQITSSAFLGSLFNVEFKSTGEGTGKNTQDSAKLNSPESDPQGFAKLQFEHLLHAVPQKQAGPLLGKIVSTGQDTQQVAQPYGLYKFSGRGWGHGVGMSQWGAYNMAQQGYTYRQILDFYYSHTKVRKISN